MVWVVRTFLGAAGIGVFLLIAGLFLPSKTQVESTIFIARPPATVYALASDTRWIGSWAPWRITDPALDVTTPSPHEGVGAQLAWDGRHGRGGEQIIRTAEPYAVVVSDLDFGPRGAALLVTSIDELSDGVQVSLRYEAPHGANVIGRYAGLVAQRRVRAVIEASLAALRAEAEALPEADFAGALILEVQMEPQTIVFAERSERGELDVLRESFAATLDDVRAFMAERGQEPSGPPIAMTLEWSPPLWRFRAGYPYVGRRGEDGTAVLYGQTEGGLTIQATHRADLRRGSELFEQLDAYMAAKRLVPAGPVREIVVTDAAVTPPEQMITQIEIPVRPLDEAAP